MTRLAHCIGCGCNDRAACCPTEGSDEPCSWLRVDRNAGRGVCSACSAYLDASAAAATRVALERCLHVLLRMIPEYCQAAEIEDVVWSADHDHAIAQAAAQIYGPDRSRWPDAVRRVAEGEFA